MILAITAIMVGWRRAFRRNPTDICILATPRRSAWDLDGGGKYEYATCVWWYQSNEENMNMFNLSLKIKWLVLIGRSSLFCFGFFEKCMSALIVNSSWQGYVCDLTPESGSFTGNLTSRVKSAHSAIVRWRKIWSSSGMRTANLQMEPRFAAKIDMSSPISHAGSRHYRIRANIISPRRQVCIYPMYDFATRWRRYQKSLTRSYVGVENSSSALWLGFDNLNWVIRRISTICRLSLIIP